MLSIPIQDCTVHHLLPVYHNPKSALILDNKISGRKDKKYHVSVIINQTELILIVFITTFFHNIVIYVQPQVWQILLAITEIHYFFDFNYTIRANVSICNKKGPGGEGSEC